MFRPSSIILIILLSGCVDDVYTPTNEFVLFVGDSQCEGFTPFPFYKSAAQFNGYIQDCKISRSLSDYHNLFFNDLLDDKDGVINAAVVFIALGDNKSVGLSNEVMLTEIKEAITGKLACVYPISKRDLIVSDMNAICDYTLDPLLAPVEVGKDGLHYSDIDSQWMLAAQLRQAVDYLKNINPI